MSKKNHVMVSQDAGMDGQKSDEVYEFNVSARPVGSTAWRYHELSLCVA